MAQSFDDDNEEQPLDPAAERIRRRLVRFMAVNLGILFFALMAVVAALVYKAGDGEAPEHAPTASPVPAPAGQAVASADILLPVGARIVSHSLSGDRIALDTELADGSRALYLFDIAQGRIVGRFAVRSE